MPQAKLISPITKQGLQKKRVAAYCRVSTNLDDQKTSYATQIRVYQKMINDNPEWTLVDIFADASDIIGLKQNPTNGHRFSPIFLFYDAI